MREATGELLEEDLHLHAGEVLAEALVHAVAEGQVLHGVRAADVDAVRVVEVARVVVGRRAGDEQLGALGDRDATDRGVPGGAPPPGRDRAGVAQALLDGVGDQVGVLADLVPHGAVLEQELDHVGGGVGGRLVGGDGAGHHHRVQVGVGDDVRLRGLGTDAERHPAGAVGVGADAVEHLAGVLPEAADAVRDGHLLLRRGPPPGVDGVRDGEALERRDVLVRDAEEVQRDGQRDVVEHLRDQVGVPLVDEGVHSLAGQAPHHLLVVPSSSGANGPISARRRGMCSGSSSLTSVRRIP